MIHNSARNSTSTSTAANKDNKPVFGRALVPFFVDDQVNEEHHIPQEVARRQKGLLVPNGERTFDVREFKDGYFTHKASNIEDFLNLSNGQEEHDDTSELQIVDKPIDHPASFNARNHVTFQLDPASPPKYLLRNKDRHYKNYEKMMRTKPAQQLSNQPLDSSAQVAGEQKKILLIPQQVTKSKKPSPQQEPKHDDISSRPPLRQPSPSLQLPLHPVSFQPRQLPISPIVHSKVSASQPVNGPQLSLPLGSQQPSADHALKKRLLPPSFFATDSDSEEQASPPKVFSFVPDFQSSGQHNSNPIVLPQPIQQQQQQPKQKQHPQPQQQYPQPQQPQPPQQKANPPQYHQIPLMRASNNTQGSSRRNELTTAVVQPGVGIHTPSPQRQREPNSNAPLTEEDILAPFVPKQLFAGHSFGSSPDPKRLPMPNFNL